VQTVSLLFPAKHEVSDHKEAVIDVTVVISPHAIQVLSHPDTRNEALFHQTVELDKASLVRVFLVIVLNSCCSEGDVGR
jgi:hypothetical protein